MTCSIRLPSDFRKKSHHLLFVLDHIVTLFPFSSQSLFPSSLSSTPLSTMQALLSPSLRPSPLDPIRNKSHFLSSTSTKCKPPTRISFITPRAAVSSSQAAPKRETDPKKRVVITGMGLVSVFGNDPDVFYDKLLDGVSGIAPIDRFDASKFPTRFAGQIRNFSSEGYIDGKNDRRLDDCLRYCIVAGKKALESADLGSDNLSKVYNFLRLL